MKNASTGYGIGGAALTFSNGGGSTTTNDSGYYTKTVVSGWSGTVTPSLAGYTFSPADRSYSAIASSHFNQDFSAVPVTYTISGYVKDASNASISGVTVNFSNSAGSAITNSSGYYSKTVPYGWSGSATPEKPGYTFTPANHTYTSVNANQAFQNYTGTSEALPDISVSPQSLVFNQPQKRRSSRKPPAPVVESMENQRFKPADGEYPTGLVIPEEVEEYWKTHTPSRRYRSKRSLPASIDWSVYDTPVRSQGSCGSCWAFATVAMIENLANRANLSIDNNFAEQVLVSCLYDGNGCSGGWYWTAFDYIKKNGIPHENCYPYAANNGNCGDTCANPNFKARINSFTPAYGLWGGSNFNVDDLKGALQEGPLCVAMYVPTSFHSYRGGVYKYAGGDYSWGHAVFLVGYDDAQRCFNVKNSWGTYWGEGGYFRISYDDVTSAVKFGSYAARASDIFIEGESGEIQEIIVANEGIADLTVSNITVDKTWLNVEPMSFSAVSPNGQQVISVSVSDWNQVFWPEDTATITFASDDPDETTVTVDVTAMMSLTAERPSLMISPPFYSDVDTDGGGNLTINVSNSGGETYLDIDNSGEGDMVWTASTSDSWLNLSQGSSGNNSGRITISYSPNTASPRTGTVTVTAEGAANSPQTITIHQMEMDNDADDDGMPDYYEFIHGFDLSNPDDAFGDADDDGLTNLKEFEIGTNPALKDSDGDCETDGYEVEHGTDPLVNNGRDYMLQDVISVLQALTGVIPENLCAIADTDRNGEMEIRDAVYILQYMAGIR